MDVNTKARDEVQMIAEVLAGDSQVFHELIRPYERSVFVMAQSFMHNQADAEDVAQDAFLKAFRNLASFRGEAKFGTWLISITLNEARSRLRRRSTLATESLDTPSDEEGHISPALLRDWKEIPSEQLEHLEVKLLLQEAVAALPPIYREVFMLRDIEELSTAEVADVLKISLSSAKIRLHRARLMMQKTLAPQLKRVHPRRGWLQWL